MDNSYQTVLHSKPLLESSSNEGFDASSQAISDMGNIIASIDSSNRTTLDNDTRTAYTTIYTSVANTQSDIGQTTMVAKMNGTASTSTNTVVQVSTSDYYS